jgi:hypothetical protein
VTRLAFVLVLAAGCSQDPSIERARSRMLAIDAAEAAQIVAFCKTVHADGMLPVDRFPSLPARPTTISAQAGVVTLAWWNNSHFEEDDPHPGFEIICSDRAIASGKQLAPGLWYLDTPSVGSR